VLNTHTRSLTHTHTLSHSHAHTITHTHTHTNTPVRMGRPIEGPHRGSNSFMHASYFGSSSNFRFNTLSANCAGMSAHVCVCVYVCVCVRERGRGRERERERERGGEREGEIERESVCMRVCMYVTSPTMAHFQWSNCFVHTCNVHLGILFHAGPEHGADVWNKTHMYACTDKCICMHRHDN